MSAITPPHHPWPPRRGPVDDDRTPTLTWGWLLVGMALALTAYRVATDLGVAHAGASVAALVLLVGVTCGGWLRALVRERR